jgi:putative ABC transport system permease protein
MIKFLFLGLLRDRSRSLFPFLVVAAGVVLTVLLHAWMEGIQNDMIRANANFSTGHVKITSSAYLENIDLSPNDLALIGIDSLIHNLQNKFGDFDWCARIRFGGLLDIPDEMGETRDQGPVMGIAVDLSSEKSIEMELLNLKESLVRGRLPQQPDEILLSDEFARKLNLNIGEAATLISSTMFGSMAIYNFIVAGTVHFGVAAMDKGAMVADLKDMQYVLNMEDTAGEVLGFFNDRIYDDLKAQNLAKEFNNIYFRSEDEFSPLMITLADQNDLGELLVIYGYYSTIVISVFVFIMALVLWNSGLMASLRRYGEIGVRLAMGECHGHIYRTLIYESFLIGIVGSICGTLMGLAVAYYLQVHGIDISYMMKQSSMLISSVFRAQITATTYYIGFIPGLLATIIGTAISGIGIYKRQTAQLFKELEV